MKNQESKTATTQQVNDLIEFTVANSYGRKWTVLAKDEKHALEVAKSESKAYRHFIVKSK